MSDIKNEGIGILTKPYQVSSGSCDFRNYVAQSHTKWTNEH